MSGWIKLHRSIKDNWLYKEKRTFSKFEAWIDILMNANHTDNKIIFDGQLLEVKRGQLITSEVKLSNKWGWSRKKVRNFLELIEQDQMIIKTIVPNKCTIIEICNYDIYQKKDTTEDTSKDIGITSIEEIKEQQNEQQENNRGTTKEQLENTNKNDKNNKELYIYIVEYLNEKTGKNFSPKTKSTTAKINARLAEGFTLDDFYKVINIKTSEWLNDADMQKYLRPETLFGNKFESYLNQKTETKNKKSEHDPYAHVEVIQ